MPPDLYVYVGGAGTTEQIYATNLSPNPGLEGGTNLGWYSNDGSAYPLTLSTVSPISGVNSMLATRQGTLNTTAASIYLQAGNLSTTSFPVTVGQPVVASMDVKCEQPNRRISFYCQWLNAAGGVISSQSQTYPVWDTGTGGANVVQRVQVTAVPPATTVLTRLVSIVTTVTGNAILGERVWYDNLRVSTGTATLDTTNLAPNPNLEQGTASNWSSSNASLYVQTVDSTAPISGLYSILHTRAATTPSRYAGSITLSGLSSGYFPVTQGVPIQAAVHVKTEQPSNRRSSAYFFWRDAGGVYLSSSPAVYTLTPPGVTRVSTGPVTPPVNAVLCNAVWEVVTVDGTNTVTGERTWFDNATITVGAGASTMPIDGNMPPDGTYVYRWAGIPNNSASERWKVTGTNITGINYFDGDTTDTLYKYRWTGTAKASTSQRYTTTTSTGIAPAASTVWDGTTELSGSIGVIPGDVGTGPAGYDSVTTMLAQNPFYIAHRGGSIDWPEHSMKAYTNSISWGCPAMEMSVNRTQDGVWVALHDADLNRTSMTSGLPSLTSMTWAQVQQYRIKINNGDEPYEKMTDILDKYAASHLFFIDPKYALNYKAELFAIVKQYPNWQKHVMKYFHSSTSFAVSARSAGFYTWGYYYQADVPQIPTTSPYWDFLGMDYLANAAAWTAIMGVGKPVIGHILPDAPAATTARSRGAKGLMCSGVKSIVPKTGI